jgi:dihydroceramide fatty acyl 2-hydroxylase
MLEYQRHESARMFESPFLEACSRVHPAVPFVFYIPIVLGLLGWALAAGVTSVAWAAAMLPAGWLTWQLMEYVIHRFFFHWEGNGPLTRRIHDISHGYHHRYPDDPLRLVMPLSVSIPLALIIAGLLWLVRWPAATVPLFCGIVSGYLFYDFCHWSTHYRTPLTEWGRTMRSHHMAHHFAVPDQNFGISHRWIDRVVGTLKRR